MSVTNAQKLSEWDAVAPAWHARRAQATAMKAALTERLLTGLALAPGERVVELGAGTGDLARRLAAAVGDSGHVLATDVSGAFVDLIATTTADLPAVESRQLDARAIDLADASYDAVVFCMGLMHVTEPDAALREMHRVLAPGGRLAVTTWAAPEHNAWLPSIAHALMTTGIIEGQSPRQPGGVFSLCDPDRLESLARSAGFHDVSVTVVDDSVSYPSVTDYVEQGTSFAPRLAAAYAAAAPEQRAALVARVDEATVKFRASGGGLVFPTRALLLLAQR